MSEVAVNKEVPKGWVSVPLEDCVEILDSRRIPLNSKERSVRTEGKSQDQLYPYYGATGQVGFIDDFIFEGEHLLIGEDAAPFFDKSKNVAYIAKGKFWVNNHAHILNALEGVTSNKYLLHYLNRFNYEGFVGGTTRLKLNQGNLKQIPVPLAPPEQQKRIVAKIEELFSHIDAGIEALKKAKQLLKQYRQSVLKAAVTGELTKEWREANKDKSEPASQLLERILKERREKWEEQQLEKFKTKGKIPKGDKWKEKYEIPKVFNKEYKFDIPKTWVSCSFESLLSEKLKNGHSAKESLNGKGIRTLTLTAVTKGDFCEKNTKITVAEPNKAKDIWLESGDILIERSNAPDLVGISKLYLGESNYAIYPDLIIRARVVDSLLPEFVEIVLQSKATRNYFKSTAQGMSGSMPKINQDIIKKLFFPLPAKKEQHVIVRQVEEKIDAFNRLIGEIEIQLMKAEKNKQSVLTSAFTGELQS